MRKLIALALFFTNCIVAQTPCTNGKAGNYPCKAYDLMANITVDVLANTNGNPESNDIWGWTDDATGKEYAIAAMTNSTAFVDITDPINPVFLGRLNSNAGNNFWRDVKVYKNHAFIVADNVGAHGMQVFDLTRLRNITSPQNFTADAIYNTDDLGSCHNIVINETSGTAYLVGCKKSSGTRLFSGGPIFVDITNPKKPVKINAYAAEGYSHDAQVVTYNGPDNRYKGREIYIGSNETKVSILDVTDKNNVVKISQISYPQLGYTHQGWFTEDHRYFLLGDETDEINFGMNTRTLIFDFSDLKNPKLSSTHSGFSSAIDHNGYVKDNLFFMANYTAGLRVFDISNISASTNSMTEIGYFDTHPESNATSFNGSWSVYPYFKSGNIIINDIEKGLFIIRKSATLSTKDIPNSVSFSLQPNPTSKGKTTIFISKNTNIKAIQVTSLLGKKILELKNLNTNSYNLDTSNLSKGIYLVNVNNTSTKKLIIN